MTSRSRPTPLQKPSYMTNCDGCHNCGHVYDGNPNELFVWKGMRWLCRRCARGPRAY